MIYLTGDCHGKFFKIYKQIERFKKGDYIIVTGDFGYWSKEQKPFFDEMSTWPFTILFVEGNHSNYDMLNELPVKQWNNGNVHFIRDNIIHLMRGQVFNIDNKKFFTFGGARSHDIKDGVLDPDDFKNEEDFLRVWQLMDMQFKQFRIKGRSWWKEEMPNEMEMHNALNVLEENDWKVDYIITHDCPTEVLYQINDNYESNILTNFLSMVDDKVIYNKWYFGHHHLDKTINKDHICLYYNIIELGEHV